MVSKATAGEDIDRPSVTFANSTVQVPPDRGGLLAPPQTLDGLGIDPPSAMGPASVCSRSKATGTKLNLPLRGLRYQQGSGLRPALT